MTPTLLPALLIIFETNLFSDCCRVFWLYVLLTRDTPCVQAQWTRDIRISITLGVSPSPLRPKFQRKAERAPGAPHV